MFAALQLMDSWEKLCVIVPAMLTLFWAVKARVKRRIDEKAARKEAEFKQRMIDTLIAIQSESKSNGGVHRKPDGKAEGTLKDFAANTNNLTVEQMDMLREILAHQRDDKSWREQVKKDLGDTHLAFAHLVVHLHRRTLDDSHLLQESIKRVDDDKKKFTRKTEQGN